MIAGIFSNDIWSQIFGANRLRGLKDQVLHADIAAIHVAPLKQVRAAPVFCGPAFGSQAEPCGIVLRTRRERRVISRLIAFFVCASLTAASTFAAMGQAAQPVDVQAPISQPVYVQPPNAQPVHAQPMSMRAPNPQPVYVQPPNAQPVHAPPVYAQPAGQGLPYRINPGDELEVLVWGDERLQRTVLVLPDGTFAFPLVGQVAAANRLPAEIERGIALGLGPQYKGPVPQVTVSVKRATGYQFSVLGKVKSPGTFTPGRYVNALEALAIAGGPTEFASTSSIHLVRKSGAQLVVVPVRLASSLRGDSRVVTSRQIPWIESGDTMVVP